nr:oligopeptide/dipeptide ABC transporter ATP-binding protein [uncultured Brevundimonas sp.]
MTRPVLQVRNLTTRFDTPEGEVRAVNDVSFSLFPGETLGVVGESGSGKTQIFLSLMGLLARNGRCAGGALFHGEDLLTLPAKRLNAARGVRLSMIFQDPMTSLNPYLTVERQMTEVLIEHQAMTRAQARRKSIAMLDRVGVPAARARIGMYPHEFSGGMRQRAMIAMALLCGPDLLIADEPTTALDVTVQAQILDLLSGLKRDFDMAIVMITHDLGVVAGISDRVMVLYGGRVMEIGPVEEIFYRPTHPYTEGLLASMPRLDADGPHAFRPIPGQPPNLQNPPSGCAFHPRCAYATESCVACVPPLQDIGGGSFRACTREIAP